MIYTWDDKLKKEDTLVPNRPIAKTHPRKLPDDKIEEVNEKWEELGEQATEYTVGKECGISASMAGKIKRGTEEPPDKERVHGSSLFLPHVAWSIDILEKKWRGIKVYIMMITEEFSCKKIAWLCGIRKSSDMAVELVKKAIAKVGYLLFILKHDNESLFTSRKFQEMLKENKIISIPSPTYWARYNGRMERSFRDLKKGLRIKDDMEWYEVENEVGRVIHLLNTRIPRKKLDGKTCDDVFYSKAFPSYDRDLLYKEYSRVQNSLPKMKNLKKSISKNKRIAGEWVLERYGLCKIKKGYWKTIQEDESVNQLLLRFVS